MRARNIKPGFFKNDELAEVEPLGRILFSGLWCMADRAGRLEDRPKKIKAEILPYDNCDINKLLRTLSDKKFLTRYSLNGINYIQINNFLKHQNPHVNEPQSTIPEPELHHTNTIQAPELNSSNPADSLIPDSGFLIPDSNIPPPAPHKKSSKKFKPVETCLPENFTISEAVQSWADKKGHTNLEKHLEAFVELCKSNGYLAVDWDMKFRRAIREDWGKVKDNGQKQQDDFERARQWAIERDKQNAKHRTI